MKSIKQHLESEQGKVKPIRVDELSKILNRGTLTIEQWRMTGRFIPVEDYASDNKDVKLLKNCTEVIEYAGASIIQVLKTGVFVFKDTKSKVLDEVENKLWRSAVEKLWCETC